jgi:hypothetical protein
LSKLKQLGATTTKTLPFGSDDPDEQEHLAPPAACDASALT